jgi:hypothetical protein
VANQYPIKLFLDSGDNRPSGSLINSSSFPTSSTSWAQATIPIPLFTIIHLNNLRGELASLQTEHTSVKSQLHAALNGKRIAERTVEELSVAQEQWRVQRDWLSRECEAHRSAADEHKSDVHALVAEVRSLRERVKLLSIDSKIIEPGSKGSNISRDSKVCGQLVPSCRLRLITFLRLNNMIASPGSWIQFQNRILFPFLHWIHLCPRHLTRSPPLPLSRVLLYSPRPGQRSKGGVPPATFPLCYPSRLTLDILKLATPSMIYQYSLQHRLLHRPRIRSLVLSLQRT